MTNEELTRFNMLCAGPCVTSEYFVHYYGISWPLSETLRRDFESWSKRFARRETCFDGWIQRFEFEKFLQHNKLISQKWMGAQLGMQESSIEGLLARLPELGMRPERYLVYPQVVAESLPQDLLANLPRLKFKSFGSLDSYKQHIHAELSEVLGFAVEPLLCATSEKLLEEPRRLANDFDSITLEPLSVKHQIWLDFKKPLSLASDRCSKLFYVENREVLRGYYAGVKEPEELEQYEESLTS